MTLTNKQQIFIAEYLKDFNATRAAKSAGYSKKTAAFIGAENLKKPYLAALIEEEKASRMMSANEVLTRLTEHARGDMGKFMDVTSMGFVLDIKKAQELGLTHLIKKIRQKVTTIIKDGEEVETQQVEIELYDAQAALVQLGRNHKLFTDQTDITSGGEKIEVVLKGLDES